MASESSGRDMIQCVGFICVDMRITVYCILQHECMYVMMCVYVYVVTHAQCYGYGALEII